MATKFQLVKSNIGELLSVNGGTVSPPQKIHAFKEVGAENYVYGWEGSTAGNFHIFDKKSYALSPKKTLHGLLEFTANIKDTTYTVDKLTDVSARYLADSPEFQWDAILAANITDVPTDINLKTGLPITPVPSKTTPATANSSIADWAWYIWVGIGVAVVGGFLLLKKGFGGKKKILSK